MASGDTLASFPAEANIPPATNYATFDTRNTVLAVYDFDDTTQETLYFKGQMPRNYGGGGITVYAEWMTTSATSGTVGWDIAIGRLNDGGQDVDSFAFATAQTITAATVPGSSGVPKVTNVVITSGANMDSVAAGDWFILRIRRDVANDNAAGDAELIGIEVKET